MLMSLHTETIKKRFMPIVDKLHAEATWVEMPPLQSVEDLKHYPEFLEHLRKSA